MGGGARARVRDRRIGGRDSGFSSRCQEWVGAAGVRDETGRTGAATGAAGVATGVVAGVSAIGFGAGMAAALLAGAGTLGALPGATPSSASGSFGVSSATAAAELLATVWPLASRVVPRSS